MQIAKHVSLDVALGLTYTACVYKNRYAHSLIRLRVLYDSLDTANRSATTDMVIGGRCHNNVPFNWCCRHQWSVRPLNTSLNVDRKLFSPYYQFALVPFFFFLNDFVVSQTTRCAAPRSLVVLLHFIHTPKLSENVHKIQTNLTQSTDRRSRLCPYPIPILSMNALDRTW